MKIELRCPSCGESLLVDDPVADGEVFCPGCSVPVHVAPNQEIRPRAETRADPSAPPDPEASAHSAGRAEDDPVVCPRCNLHFIPRRAREHVPGPETLPTVLVVEDMEYFREIARDALAHAYRIETAATVADARDALARGGIDLLLLDLTLDGGDQGVELLRALPSKPCPVLIYTAQDESEMYGDRWDELRSLGADDIVMKGMNVGESLARKVGALLGRTGDDEERAAGATPRR